MIELHGLTDRGRKRQSNEDSIGLDPAIGLAVVADGMGGHQSGEVASNLAVQALQEFVVRAHRDRDLTWPFGFDPGRSFEANCLATGVKLANQAVFLASTGHPDLAGMGTTIIAVLARTGQVSYASVGDSRAYLVRGDTVRRLTRDDSWLEAALAQKLIDLDEADDHPLRHVLTKAVGLQADVEFDVGEEALQDGDRVLLCSDGLTTTLSDQQIREILHARKADLGAACRALVAAANDAGGPDNVTVVLVRQTGR